MLKFGLHFYPTGLKPEITCTFVVIDKVLDEYQLDGILSSAIDRKHGWGSLHYVGLGIDVTWPGFQITTTQEKRQSVRDALKYRLGPNYDVVLELDHIHIEYQPKVAVNIIWRNA